MSDEAVRFSGGTGADYKQAVIIEGATSSMEGAHLERGWLTDHFGQPGTDWKIAEQALITEEGRPFDRVRLLLADGSRREIWFDISSFYGTTNWLFAKPAFARPAEEEETPPQRFPEAIERDIAEAVFRYHLGSGGGVAFLMMNLSGAAQDASEPDDAFMHRFAGHPRMIRRETEAMSAAEYAAGRNPWWRRLLGRPPAPLRGLPYGGIVERQSGRPGAKYRVGRVWRIDDATAEVESGWYAGPVAAWDGRTLVRREGERWVGHGTTRGIRA